MEGDTETLIRRGLTGRWTARLRASATPYVISLVLAVMLAAYANYIKDRIDPAGFTFRGQGPGIYLPFLFFPVILLLWLLYRDWGPRFRWTTIFLSGLAASWIIHFALIQVHGDLYTHTVWLFVPAIVMLAWKQPSWTSVWAALRVMAWAAVIIMAITMAFEKLGWVPQFDTGSGELAAWENARYWLPLRDVFQIDSRWPGPFGYNSKTAFMSVFVIVIALADRRWRRWVLLGAGVVGLLLTSGRGAYLALAAGLAVLFLFTPSGPVGRVPVRIRLAVGALGLFLTGIVLYTMGSLGLTGREGLWDGFLTLWRESIWIGVGQQGVAGAPQIVTWMDPSWMDAHNIYIEELAKFGVVGSLAIFATLALGVGLALMAAVRGWPLPLAVLAVYLVAGLTDLLNDGWETMSTPLLMVTLAALGASAWLSRDSGTAPTTSEGGIAAESARTQASPEDR